MSRQVELSRRLCCVAQMVSRGKCVADVGCDHGFVSIYLVQNHIAERVLAMDVNRGPLLRAAEHIEQYALGNYIETRRSNGLAAVTREDAVETAILAGMGGRLMEKILQAALQRGLVIPELVLQPQSEWTAFRRFLRTQEYYIVRENMILEEEKFYPVLKVRHKSVATEEEISLLTRSELPDALCDSFGPLLLREKNPVLEQYLDRELHKYDTLLARLTEQQKQKTTMLEKRRLMQQAKELFYAV